MDLGLTDLLPGPLSIAAADSSRYMAVRPLSVPGAALEPWMTGYNRRFKGNDFLLQFKVAGGTGASFEGEICGMRSYRRKTWGASYDGETDNGSIEVSYVFNASDPEEEWEVDVLRVETGSEPGSPVYLRVDLPDHGDYSVVETISTGSEKLLTVGTSDFEDEVFIEFLRGEAGRFGGQPEDYRRAVATFSAQAAQSDTAKGWYAFVEIAWVKAMADIGNDVLGYTGFTGDFDIYFDLEERLNEPVLYDEGSVQEAGLGIYTAGFREWAVSEPIGAKIWKDAHGIFDAEPAALEDVGWKAGEDNMIPPLLNGGPSGMAKGCFLGIDGTTVYRVTIEAGKYIEEDWVMVQQLILEVPVQQLVDWGFDREALETGDATGWQFTQLERLVEESWEVVAVGFDCYTHIRPDFYNPDAKIFWGGRWRAGDRWGFPELNEATPGPESNYYKVRKLLHERSCSSTTE